MTDTASALPEGASERLELGSGSIHVQRGGEGAPLLFLHAAGGAGAWHPFLGLLARHLVPSPLPQLASRGPLRKSTLGKILPM